MILQRKSVSALQNSAWISLSHGKFYIYYVLFIDYSLAIFIFFLKWKCISIFKFFFSIFSNENSNIFMKKIHYKLSTNNKRFTMCLTFEI